MDALTIHQVLSVFVLNNLEFFQNLPNQTCFKAFLHGIDSQLALFLEISGSFQGLGFCLQDVDEPLAVDFLIGLPERFVDDVFCNAFLDKMETDFIDAPAALCPWCIQPKADRKIQESGNHLHRVPVPCY